LPIFISYNSNDRLFAENLATRLVADGHSIWIDKWELSIGDSLIEKIQAALGQACAVIAILSKHSVASNWCKKEINATLVRELEKSGSLLLPCVVDDCQIPLFLMEKRYADFRATPREAFKDLSDALRKFSNRDLARIDHPTYHSDMGFSCATDEDSRRVMEWKFVDHSQEMPFSILTELTVTCNKAASKHWDSKSREGNMYIVPATVLSMLCEVSEIQRIIICDSQPAQVKFKISGGHGMFFSIILQVRRLGHDTGKDLLVTISDTLQRARLHMLQETRAAHRDNS
jgi:hypothetical protein